MSKASEWVKNQYHLKVAIQALGLPLRPEFRDRMGRCVARVDDSGGMWIFQTGDALSLTETLAFGRWVLDIFEDRVNDGRTLADGTIGDTDEQDEEGTT